MEDIKLGRSLDSQVRVFVGPTGVIVAGANKKRVALTFSYDGAAAAIVKFSPSRVNATTAFPVIVINTGNPTRTITVEEFGPLLNDDWLGTDSSGTSTVCVTDSILQRMD